MQTTQHKPTIIAHRGNNETFPENSLAGLRSAFELGCTAVEFDIQMTADGVLAIIHDTTTQRTSDRNQLVFEHDFAELSTTSIHEPTRFTSQHKPTPISRLEDFLPLLDEFPNTHAYIELKKQSLDKWGHQTVLNKLLPLVVKYQQQCTIISFDLHVLTLIKESSPINIGWVLDDYDAHSLAQAKRVQPAFLIIDQERLTLDETPWQGHWEWMIYGVDNADLAFAHYNNGIQHIETDQLPTLLSDARLTP